MYVIETEYTELLEKECLPCYGCGMLRNAVHFDDNEKSWRRAVGADAAIGRECKDCLC